jgi:sporulation protein YlmC with PRC-barrel domain
MSKQEKAMTKDRLIGMKVINAEGKSAGTIKDITFTVGKMGMTLLVKNEDGEDVEVPWDQIQAAGDFVLLKPAAAQQQTFATQSGGQPQQAQTQQPICPTCGGPLTYIQQYQRWYCYKDKKYV